MCKAQPWKQCFRLTDLARRLVHVPSTTFKYEIVMCLNTWIMNKQPNVHKGWPHELRSGSTWAGDGPGWGRKAWSNLVWHSLSYWNKWYMHGEVRWVCFIQISYRPWTKRCSMSSSTCLTIGMSRSMGLGSQLGRVITRRWHTDNNLDTENEKSGNILDFNGIDECIWAQTKFYHLNVLESNLYKDAIVREQTSFPWEVSCNTNKNAPWNTL